MRGQISTPIDSPGHPLDSLGRALFAPARIFLPKLASWVYEVKAKDLLGDFQEVVGIGSCCPWDGGSKMVLELIKGLAAVSGLAGATPQA